MGDMLSPSELREIAPVRTYMEKIEQSWQNYPNNNTLIQFSVEGRWTDFYTAELDALVRHNATTQQTDPLIDPSSVLYDGMNYLLTNITDPSLMDVVCQRSVFTVGFHQVLAKSTTFPGLLAAIDAIADKATVFAGMHSQNESFKVDFKSHGGSFSISNKHQIRNSILERVGSTGRVNLHTPEHIYTIFVVCHTLDDRIFEPAFIEQGPCLPVIFYLTKTIREKTPQEYYLPSFALNQRPFIGPTSCDPMLAFSMANLSGVSPTTSVFDPFSGTSSILLACRRFTNNTFGLEIDSDLLYRHNDIENHSKRIERVRKRFEQRKLKNPTKRLQIPFELDPSHPKHVFAPKCIQDNFTHQGFTRPELLCADTFQNPLRRKEYHGETVREYFHAKNIPVSIVADGCVMYRTKLGVPIDDANQAIATEQEEFASVYHKTVMVPQLTAMIQRYCHSFNAKIDKKGERDTTQMSDINVDEKPLESNNQIQAQVSSAIHGVPRNNGTWDCIICDPPYGIRARSSKICAQYNVDDNGESIVQQQSQLGIKNVILAELQQQQQQQQQHIVHDEEINQDDNQTQHDDTAPQSHQQKQRKTGFDKQAFRREKRAERKAEHNNLPTTQTTAEHHVPSPQSTDISPSSPPPSTPMTTATPSTSSTTTTPTSTPSNLQPSSNQPKSISRHVMTIDDVEKGRYVAQTMENPMHNVLLDLFQSSAETLVLGGRLCYLLPTCKCFPRHLLPSHPCFTIRYACMQQLSTWFNRWAIVMEKTAEYDPELHGDWTDQQLLLGTPVWSPTVNAKARMLANYRQVFDESIFWQAKQHIDQFGTDEGFDDDLATISS